LINPLDVILGMAAHSGLFIRIQLVLKIISVTLLIAVVAHSNPSIYSVRQSATEMSPGQVAEAVSESGLILVTVAVANIEEQQAFPEAERPRAALLAASLLGKDAIATYLFGRSLDSKIRISSAVSIEEREASESRVRKDTVVEQYISTVSGILAGVMIVEMDVNEGEVRVTLASTPTSRAEVMAVGARVVLCADTSLGSGRIREDVINGALPPVGTRLLAPSVGAMQWIAWGGAIPKSSSSADIKTARIIANQRANRAWIAAVNGEKIDSKDGFISRFETMTNTLVRNGKDSEIESEAAQVHWESSILHEVSVSTTGSIPGDAKRIGLDESIVASVDGAIFVFLHVPAE